MRKPQFCNLYTALQKSMIDRLAEIEREDADACAGCGGEDCACCEIYHDRMKWVSPEELFENDYDPAEWHANEQEFICNVCGEFVYDEDGWQCDCGNIIHESCANNDGECSKCAARRDRYRYPF